MPRTVIYPAYNVIHPLNNTKLSPNVWETSKTFNIKSSKTFIPAVLS